MPLLNPAVALLERSLPKVITPRTHGIIDYSHAAFFATVAFACRKTNKPAAWTALATSAALLAQSLLTDYPLGVKPVLSFETHGKIDAAFASSSWTLPRLCGFAGTGAARIFVINSLVEAAVVGLTSLHSDQARAEQL